MKHIFILLLLIFTLLHINKAESNVSVNEYLCTVNNIPEIDKTSIDTSYAYVLNKGLDAVPFLIESLTDTAKSEVHVPFNGERLVIGDIAFTLLTDIIKNTPTNDFLEQPQNKNIGFWDYWSYVRINFVKRAIFKQKFKNWYNTNEKYLIKIKRKDKTYLNVHFCYLYLYQKQTPFVTTQSNNEKIIITQNHSLYDVQIPKNISTDSIVKMFSQNGYPVFFLNGVLNRYTSIDIIYNYKANLPVNKNDWAAFEKTSLKEGKADFLNKLTELKHQYKYIDNNAIINPVSLLKNNVLTHKFTCTVWVKNNDNFEKFKNTLKFKQITIEKINTPSYYTIQVLYATGNKKEFYNNLQNQFPYIGIIKPFCFE